MYGGRTQRGTSTVSCIHRTALQLHGAITALGVLELCSWVFAIHIGGGSMGAVGAALCVQYIMFITSDNPLLLVEMVSLSLSMSRDDVTALPLPSGELMAHPPE